MQATLSPLITIPMIPFHILKIPLVEYVAEHWFEHAWFELRCVAGCGRRDKGDLVRVPRNKLRNMVCSGYTSVFVIQQRKSTIR